MRQDIKPNQRMWVHKKDSAIHGKQVIVKGFSASDRNIGPHWNVVLASDENDAWAILEKNEHCLMQISINIDIDDLMFKPITSCCTFNMVFCKGLRFDYEYCTVCGSKRDIKCS